LILCRSESHRSRSKRYRLVSDLFGPGGQQLLATTRLAVESRSRVDSVLRVITALDFEIDTFARLVAGRLRGGPGYTAIQVIPGVGPLLGAVFVAEIGDINPLHPPATAGFMGRADPDPVGAENSVTRAELGVYQPRVLLR
jgi:transposase